MPVTAAGINNALNVHYLPRLRNEVKRSFLMLKLAQEAEKLDMTGQALTVTMQVGRSAGIYRPSAAGGVFPASTQSTYQRCNIPWARGLGAIGWDNEDELRAQDSSYSFVNLLEKEMADLRDSFSMDLAWMFYRGTNGPLATVTSFTNGTPDVIGVDTTEALEPGMAFDVYSNGSPVSNYTNVTLTTITGLQTFTATGTGTPAVGDTIHRASSYGNEPQGLANIISATATLQGLTTAVGGYTWQANVVGSASAPAEFSPKAFKNLTTLIERRARGNRESKTIVCSPEVANAVAWVMLGQRGYQNTTKFELYWDSFTVDGQTWVVDPDCPKRVIYIVDKSGLVFGNLGGNLIDLVGKDGMTRRLAIDQATGRFKDAWQVLFTSYAQLGCTRRVGQGAYLGVYGLDDVAASYGEQGGIVR